MKFQKWVYGDLEIEVCTENMVMENNPKLPKEYPKIGDVVMITNWLNNGLFIVTRIFSYRPKYYLEEGKLTILYDLLNINNKKTFTVSGEELVKHGTVVDTGKIEG